jgi:hypothetical protein
LLLKLDNCAFCREWRPKDKKKVFPVPASMKKPISITEKCLKGKMTSGTNYIPRAGCEVKEGEENFFPGNLSLGIIE